MRVVPFLIAVIVCLAGSAQAATKQQPQPSQAVASQPVSSASLGKIQRIVVLYLENHSFDNLYGEFPGAEGIQKSDQTSIQAIFL